MNVKLQTRVYTGVVMVGLLAGSAVGQQYTSASAGGDVRSEDGADASRSARQNNTVAPLGTGSESSQYPLGVADLIHVSVWKNNDLSQTVTVGPDGFVSLPLLGDVRVEGLTTSQLGALLKSRLEELIVSPQVTVSVVEIHSRQVYITGQVSKPGGYPLIAPVSLLQLIAKAGGLSPFADRSGIYVLRDASGRLQKIPMNYKNLLRGKDDQHLVLQPGDTVIVP